MNFIKMLSCQFSKNRIFPYTNIVFYANILNLRICHANINERASANTHIMDSNARAIYCCIRWK